MMTAISVLLLISIANHVLSASDWINSFEERAKSLQDFLVTQSPDLSPKTVCFYASVHYGFHNDSYADRLIESTLDVTADFAGFFDYSLMDTYMRWNKRMSTAIQHRVQDHMLNRSLDIFIKDTTPPRINTPNQMLMRGVAAYLAGQEWAHPKFQEATEYLHVWLAKVTQGGMTEFDSTTYHAIYGAALTTLQDFAIDDLIRHKAAMALQWLYLGVADEWLQGWWVSTTFRDYIKTTSPEASGAGSILAWLLLGSSLRQPRFQFDSSIGHAEPHFAVPSSFSSFRLPSFVEDIASMQGRHEAGGFRTVRESHNIYFDPTTLSSGTASYFQWVFRSAYLTATYGVTSHAEEPGLVLGDNCHSESLGTNNRTSRWLVRWPSEHPERGTTCFFEQRMDDGGASFNSSLTPHEQVLQHAGIMLAVYNIRSGEEIVDGWLPAGDQDSLIDGNWLYYFFEQLYLAVAVAGDFKLSIVTELLNRCEYHRLVSPGRRNAVVMITAGPEEYDNLLAFQAAVLRSAKVDFSAVVADKPAVTLQWAGDLLSIQHDGDRVINGVVVDFKQWPLMELTQGKATWLSQEVGARLEVSTPTINCTYNFGAWVTDCA